MKPVPLFDDRNLGVSMYRLRPLVIRLLLFADASVKECAESDR